MIKYTLIIAMLSSLIACGGIGQVRPVDSKSGYFSATKGGTAKAATITTNKPLDLDSRKALILVPTGDFTGSMVKNIGYFDEVINFDDLEKALIQNNLTDEIPSLNGKIAMNKAAKKYKPFLWLHWDTRKDGNKSYQQLILSDPITLEDYFISETYLDYVWAGVSDQANAYPAFNALIDYIKANSKTYK